MKQNIQTTCSFFLIFVFATGCSLLDSGDVSGLTEPTAPQPTNTTTLAPSETPTFTATDTLVPSPTPTAMGGGLGKIVFNAFVGEQGSGSQNIYLHDMEKNETKLILEDHLLYDVSKDGKQLLVSNEQNLTITDLDGFIQTTVAEQINYLAGFITKGQSDEIVVFTKEVNGIVQVFFKHLDGPVEQVTESSVGVSDFQLPIFDDSLLWEEGYSTETAAYSYGWRLTNLHTKETTELSYLNPVVSPKGQYLAYSVGSDIFQSNLLRVTDQEGETVIELQADHYVENPIPNATYFFESFGWNPGNNHLFVSIDSRNTTGFESVADVFVNLDGAVQQEISTELSPIAWSPDGRQYIGFKRVGEPPQDRQVMVLAIDFTQENEILIDIDEEIIFFESAFWLP